MGNYVGAISQSLTLAGEYDAIFCIVDYHALTHENDPKTLSENALKAAAMLLACGLTPDRCTLFIQSQVPEHTELAWILGTVTPMGDLSRMTQYKDKAKSQADNVNAGLFTYPVLQAADILLYKAVVVPVGEDQAQHLELSREIARKFNARFGPVFPEPATLLTATPRIMGTDGKRKMSKSLGNHIGIAEEPDQVWKKLSTAVTDENRKRRTDPGNPDVCNIYTLHKFFTEVPQVREIDRDCRSAAIGCVDCKKILAGTIEARLGPTRQRYQELMHNPAEIQKALEAGGARCRTIARETMKEVRRAVGLA